MKQFMLTFITAAIALCAVAQAPRLTRAQLLQTPPVKDHTVAPSASPAKDKPLSLQQVMKERNLTLDDNKLNTKAPSRQDSDDEFLSEGKRIASVETYDFDWDNDGATAAVIDSTGALMGKYCSIRYKNNQYYLSGFYGSYYIPISIDDDGVVTIQAGMPLDTIRVGLFNSCLLYVVPLSWLTGETEYCEDIHAVLHDDGSIEFSEGFGFLVKKTVFSVDRGEETAWGLSPIFTNLVLYQPNATHHYYDNTESQGGQEPGTGGYVIIDLVYLQDDVYYPNGGGGTVPKPINPRPGAGSAASTGTTKPINPPRQFRPTKMGMNHNPGNSHLQIDSSPTNAADGIKMTGPSRGESGTPVYMYQFDDTTLMVYNLYGEDYCWNYIKINPDRSFYFPSQPIGCTDNGDPLYNCTGYHAEADTLMWGNLGTYSNNKLFWGDTYLCCEAETEGSFDIKSSYGCNWIEFENSNAINVPDWPCPTPENLTAAPTATTASVAWEDTNNTGWRLRYRPFVDTPFLCNLNGDYDDVFMNMMTWDYIDLDEDGKGWGIEMVDDGDYCFSSYSWDRETSTPLDPENYLISPEVKLQGELSFTIWGGCDGYIDHLMVYAMMGDSVYQLVENEFETTSTPTTYTIDLSDFNGVMGNIVFLHCNSYDQGVLLLDDIFIGTPGAEIVEPAEWTYVNGIMNRNYTIEGLTPETVYEVSVRGLNASNQISDWTQPVYFTTLEKPSLRGDVNNDGKVSIADVTALINALLSDNFECTDNFNYDNADCDQSGEVKISDVTTLINYLLCGSW